MCTHECTALGAALRGAAIKLQMLRLDLRKQFSPLSSASYLQSPVTVRPDVSQVSVSTAINTSFISMCVPLGTSIPVRG
ncbi:hypothetical protein AAHC03_079 [Spirometra sp. Aus1]